MSLHLLAGCCLNRETSHLTGGSQRYGAARRTARRKAISGFTMIELMIVVAIIAILTAIAYPSYVSYITKTHRVAAEGCLSEHANYMERLYTTNLSYNATSSSLQPMDCDSIQQTGSYYQYDFPAGSLSVSAYTVEAIPQGSQATRDASCGTLKIDQAGTRTPSQCW